VLAKLFLPSIVRGAVRSGCVLARVVYNTNVMGLSPSRRLVRGAALVAAALLLGVGTFLSWSAAGSEITTAAAGSHVAQGVDGYPLNGSQLAVPGGDVEEADKGPVNAVLLTALLLACSFGITVGWQLACDRRQPASCVPGRPSFEAAREDAPFLSVFRL
jgi:hypothetical protein